MLEKTRYKLVCTVMKYLTPNLYKKIEILSLVKPGLCPYISLCTEVPRPSIKFMKELFGNDGVSGAEIGVLMGVNSESILKELNINLLYLIDPWEEYNGYLPILDHEKNYNIVYNKFHEDKRVKIIKGHSNLGALQIHDDSLDFVYIDGNHEYSYVIKDIKIWYPKVIENGVIAGYDVYNNSNVLRAVKDFCIENKIIFHVEPPDWYFIKEGVKCL